MTTMYTRARRILIDSDPFAGDARAADEGHGDWSARWVAVAGADSTDHIGSTDSTDSAGSTPTAPLVAGYRLPFTLDTTDTVRLHVSADERYELYLDGELVGRGPSRGDIDHWNFETYEFTANPGQHLIAARVWSIGAEAPYAQFSLGHAFVVGSETHPALETGTGPWAGAELPGYSTLPKGAAWGTGLKTSIDGAQYPWGWEHGDDTAGRADWARVVEHDIARAAAFANDIRPARLLVPTVIPAQRTDVRQPPRVRHAAEWVGDTTGVAVRAADSDPADERAWQAMFDGGTVTIPAHARRRVLIDFDDYVCAYPRIVLDGGQDATVRLNWQESLVDAGGDKGDRDEIEGKYFRSPKSDQDVAVGDRFAAGGSVEESSPLWWQAGRFVEVLVETADAALTIRSLRFVETGYPYENRSTFRAGQPEQTGQYGQPGQHGQPALPDLAAVQSLAFRTLQACSHETTVDCPFYEQLQYAGDARIQCLVAYLTTGDDRLARQALTAFDNSRGPRGITTSRYPSAIRQHIPPFSLWWVAMVSDFAAWRGDLDFVRTLMPGVHAVLDAFRSRVGDDGFLVPLLGWNFVDWVPGWDGGTPPNAQWRPSSIGNLQLAHVADLAARLETWLGDDEYAAQYRRLADTARAGAEAFWDEDRGLYADDLDHTAWSVHAQALAVLAGAKSGSAALTRAIADADADADSDHDNDDLAPTSLYFDHYLFEALGAIGRVDVILRRLGDWSDLAERGLHTVIEEPEPTRSDCHAWGAHPLFHLFATVLGIRPTAPGMAAIAITPHPDVLARIDATLPTPLGELIVHLADGDLTIDAPEAMRVEPVTL